MKLNDLAQKLEANRASVSEAKMKVSNLLSLNSIEFEAKVQKKFDSAINHISKMIISLYSGIKYNIPYAAYNDDKPFFFGQIKLKEGYSLDTELSYCEGILNKVIDDMKNTVDVTKVFDRKTLEQVKIKKAYTTSRLEVIKMSESASKSINGIAVVLDEKETEE